MCGILATVGLERPFAHHLLDKLRKRGPDAIGFWSDGRVNIGHTRLAILGLSHDNDEPLENDRYVLAYNGEIYNFMDLKAELASKGELGAHANDAAVLLAGWAEHGEKILERLNGFWAFVIYDKLERKIILGRDQVGIKPLYYYAKEGRFCVSSTLGSVSDTLGGGLELDYLAMSEYVRYQYTFGDKTFFKNVKKVLPGHLVELSLDTMEIETRCYENIFSSLHNGDGTQPNDEWLATTKEMIEDCVVESTISDTSYTTFCSGGIDSSLITSIAKPELAYHCNFSDPECNETFYAQQVVEDIDTRLFTVNAEEDFNLIDKLRDIVEDFDELTIGSVILPLEDLLSQVKRRHKVILTGTGGDELFAGYVRFMLARGECRQDSYRGLFAKVMKLNDLAKRFELCHQKGNMGVYKFYDEAAQRSFEDEFNSILEHEKDELATMLRFDQRNFLRGLLNIDDKMGGRHSVESRPPFLHQRLLRHLQQADLSKFMPDGELKLWLRKMAEGQIPNSVIYRKDKMGFTTPIGTFVNNSAGEIRETIMDSPFSHLYDLKNMQFTAESKFSRETFGLLMLDLWLNRYAVPVQA
ncbi:MAG: asparagine synthase (glutamine-hydrolyzing) [Gammaproteobacteria bacterium]